MASSSSSSGLTFKLHPLVIVNISDHHTRIKSQALHCHLASSSSSSSDPAHSPAPNGALIPAPHRVYGCVIGVQRGRTVEIFNSFELVFDSEICSLDRAYLEKKQELYKKVFPDYYILGWYSTGSDAEESDMQIHRSLMDINESPIYVLLNPTINHSQKDLPVTIFESELHVIDGFPQLIFVRSSYTIETVEAERISIDHVAHLKPSDGGSAATQLAAHLTGIHSAIKMLNSRIRVVQQYLLAMQRAMASQPNHEVVGDASSTRHVPSGSSDPGWKYAFLTSKTDPNTVTCALCGKIVKGGINRMKQHLAHVKGNVASCPKADFEIRKEVKEYLDNTQKKKCDKSKDLQEMKDEVANVFMGSSATPYEREDKRQKVSEASEECKMHQSSIKDAFCKEQRARVNKYVAKFFYDCQISFNVVTHKSFIRMCEAIGQYGSGYKPPSYYEISETLLNDEVEETKEFISSHKQSWKKGGCSIMTGAWTDMRGRSIMNFCVNSESGICFLKSVDSSSESHTAEYIFNLVDEIVQEVGVDDVVQVVTDNASASLAAGRILRTKYPRIFWSSCAAHCIDLMLEEFGKEPKVKNAITKARSLTTFIYSHARTLSLMRQFTQKGEIVRPGQTRFATTFLTLQSVMDKKEKLRLMFSSDEWRQCKWSRTKKGEMSSSIVFSAAFWNQVSMTLKIFSPLVYVLRIVDGDQRPSMGFIYGSLLDARKEIMSVFKDNEAQYKPFIDGIDSKSKGRLDSPLHLAAYFLNPYYYYRDSSVIERGGYVVEGFMQCMEIFYPDLEIQDVITSKELFLYKNAQGSFGKPLAVKQRSTPDDQFRPGDIPMDNSLLRQVSSLLRRLPAIESAKFQDDFLMEYNDTLLITYLAMITNCSSTMNELVEKFNTAYDRHNRRGGRSTAFI